jgi:eukaryotic-like serine/threonine-protein kinase
MHPDFVVRRVGTDMYLLGNLTAFMFSGVNMTPAIFQRLDQRFHPNQWGGIYEDVLPHVQRAFLDALAALRPHATF